MTEGPAQWLSPSLPAPKGLSVSRGSGCYNIIYYALLAQYNHQPAKEPHGSMNQNYTVDQLALFIASNCHNYVAWDCPEPT